jgi:integrase
MTMASISTDKSGSRRLMFKGFDGKRQTIYLGQITKRSAEEIKRHVEHLFSVRLSGLALPSITSDWISNLNDSFLAKLVKHDLVGSDIKPAYQTLGEHIDAYRLRIDHLKDSTQTHWNHTFRNLLKFFGKETLLTSIHVGNAKDFEKYLASGSARMHRYGETPSGVGLSRNTIKKRISNTKTLFHDAVNRKLIPSNPFSDLKSSVGANRDRDYFVTQEETYKAINACPDAEWRLIIALARFGGIRIPSELVALQWSDINWEEEKITIHSSKTEHHQGKGIRIIPLFHEIRPYLEEQYELAESGTPYVIVTKRNKNCNLRQRFKKIIGRAGLKPWPKLFQNMRASRSTELIKEFPEHVVTAWMGHSKRIAQKHYLQVTEADFKQATENPTQNPTQHVTVTPRIDSQPQNTAHEKRLVLQGNASSRDTVQPSQVGDEGLEPPTSSV